MMDANIERLLGGYATNTLTDTERSALFEAALADQELFNALQDEETLRDLLQDAESRRAIERALQQPATQRPAAQHPAPQHPAQTSRPWLMPIWAWGLAGSAVATAAFIFALLMPRTAYQNKLAVVASKPALTVVTPGVAVQERSAPPYAAREQAEPVARRKSVAKPAPSVPKPVSPASEPAQTEQSPAPPPPQIANSESLVIALAEQGQSAAQLQAAPGQAGFRGASGGYMPAYVANISSIPYALVKRGADGSLVRITQSEELKAGDSVQMMIHPPVSGSLTIQEQVRGGTWKTIFPIGNAGLPVAAKQDVVVPDSPLEVNGPQQLRLVLTSAPLPASIALSRAAKLAVARDKQRLESSQASSETPGPTRILVTNVSLAPGKASPGTSTNK